MLQLFQLAAQALHLAAQLADLVDQLHRALIASRALLEGRHAVGQAGGTLGERRWRRQQRRRSQPRDAAVRAHHLSV
ncbi:hypothetical protein LJB71_14305 [Thermomonas sp. S9]|nr:hypothetical protein [Thermomonas sp. S9]